VYTILWKRKNNRQRYINSHFDKFGHAASCTHWALKTYFLSHLVTYKLPNCDSERGFALQAHGIPPSACK
jgi:hypothetical protein